METQDLINVLFGALGITLGWVMANLKDSIKSLHDSDVELKKSVQEMAVLVAGQYVTWAGLKDVISPMTDTLRRIENKLDNKMDKSECEAHHK